jgi:1,4-alpha-glucan branching enzyme
MASSVGSAAFLIEEMHVDGLRVDLTQAMHRDNTLNANGESVSSANIFGQKLLREWSRTLRMIRPSVMLIAEDHSGWDAVTKLPAAGGLGFDATWYAAFYHNLIGDDNAAEGMARLLKEAGTGGNDPLDFAGFSGVLYATSGDKVVYHESHDEAGNAPGTARTMVIAVNRAPSWGRPRWLPRLALASPSASRSCRPAPQCSLWPRRSAPKSHIGITTS